MKPIRTVLGDEPGRIAALHRLDILDTEAESAFEDVVALVRAALHVPIAAVSLIDADRQWFKARVGLDVSETPRSVSFCSHAIEDTEPFLIADALEDVRFANNALVNGPPNVRSYAGIPIRTAEGYNVGALCAIDHRPRQFTPTEVAMLCNLARIVEKELELRRIADRDALTGCLTRRAFAERAVVEIDRFHRYGRPCSLVMADIDHFKAVNDTHGHIAGDCVLREVAQLVMQLKRDGDVLGRLGGEEFAVLLPETSAGAARAAVDRFRRTLEQHTMTLPGGERLRVTASFGIAELSGGITMLDEWLAAADQAMYAAKRGGRNRCEICA
ncbi:sensor domain-containing diguanylate cyclase [Novosphingobium sp. SG919]|uniref:diguanylate cyclase n=1 Tax=unclassified Novosphingobium TaxID=2644732 RepID=UPI00183A9E1C|nr:diguanylate cyclase (GGDEF)-like protein [Novosphingobium sp. SG919]NMN87734.1 diguanylate cyclase (GGDEF)-like protein [Novosphingobium sp. SG916]